MRGTITMNRELQFLDKLGHQTKRVPEPVEGALGPFSIKPNDGCDQAQHGEVGDGQTLMRKEHTIQRNRARRNRAESALL